MSSPRTAQLSFLLIALMGISKCVLRQLRVFRTVYSTNFLTDWQSRTDADSHSGSCIWVFWFQRVALYLHVSCAIGFKCNCLELWLLLLIYWPATALVVQKVSCKEVKRFYVVTRQAARNALFKLPRAGLSNQMKKKSALYCCVKTLLTAMSRKRKLDKVFNSRVYS